MWILNLPQRTGCAFHDANLIGKEAAVLKDRASRSTLQTPMQQVENANLELWEHHIQSAIESDGQLLKTERQALILARRVQTTGPAG
jgi:hypothetical protein